MSRPTPQWAAAGGMMRCWALAEQGSDAEGMVQLRQGMAIWQGIGIEAGQPYWLALLAETSSRQKPVEEGARVLAEAFVLVNKNGERWWEAELHRLTGELLRQQSVSGAEVETYFRQALDVARCQDARSLELRAATRLSRLWQQQGRRQEAHDLLAPIYGWFTEGFDTADLQEAKPLLKTLS